MNDSFIQNLSNTGLDPLARGKDKRTKGFKPVVRFLTTLCSGTKIQIKKRKLNNNKKQL